MKKPYYEFFCPVKIIAGHQALENIPFELHLLAAKKPLIITDHGIEKNHLLAPIQHVFADADMPLEAIFADVPADSSIETVQAAAQYYRQHGCDSILAVGGGSVIDTAKATNILVSENHDDLLQFSGAHNLPRPLKPLFVIPTTSGTGSEVTMVAVISDHQNHVKIPFASYYLMPNATFLDARMTQTLPPYLTAMTAMDAMTHAIESYTSLAANPLSDAYATAALQKISQSLFQAIASPQDSHARLELAQASTMAGIAFSNAMVGTVHALGHALGAISQLPHGVCMNIFLPYVLEFNQDQNADKLATLLLPLAGAEVYAQTPAEQRAKQVIEYIKEIRNQLHATTQLPRTLQETGRVTRQQLPQIAQKALDDGSIIYNIKQCNVEDLLAILESSW